MEFKDRFKQSRIKLGVTQDELAKMVGVSQTAINKIEIGSTLKPRDILKLATKLKVSPHWLLTGENLDPVNNYVQDLSLSVDEAYKQYNKSPLLVPLISWVQAGSWSEVIDNFQPGEADERYPCPEKHSENTFALKVIGESMFPDFIPGEIIYVDPNVKAESGSCVVIRQNGDTEATFKQLMMDGSKKYLKALNPNWPNPIIEMLPDATICGVVIGSYRKRN